MSTLKKAETMPKLNVTSLQLSPQQCEKGLAGLAPTAQLARDEANVDVGYWHASVIEKQFEPLNLKYKTTAWFLSENNCNG